MSEVKRAITDAMRQRIYEMWISGYKVANIAADIGVNAHTVKREVGRGPPAGHLHRWTQGL